MRVLGARGSTNGERGSPVGHRKASRAAVYSKSWFNLSRGGCCTYGASNMSQEAQLRSFNLRDILGRPAGTDRNRARELKMSRRFARLGSGARPECRDPQIELFSLDDARTTGNLWVRRRLAPASFCSSYFNPSPLHHERRRGAVCQMRARASADHPHPKKTGDFFLIQSRVMCSILRGAAPARSLRRSRAAAV